jgi:hypothetical protein
MRRVELTEATLAGWARLNAEQRQRFFEAFLAAALRLDRLEFRAWLRRRLQMHPLIAPFDPGAALADADLSAFIKAANQQEGRDDGRP